MKKFRIISIIWAALFGCLLTANAQTEMYAMLDSTLWNTYAQEETIDYVKDDVSMAYSIGISPAPASYDPQTQYFTHYTGSTLTFGVPGSYRITNIVITCNRDNTTYTPSTGSVVDNGDGSGCTWTGDTQSLILTLESTGESPVSYPSSSIATILVTYVMEDNPDEVDFSVVPSVSGNEHTFNFNAINYDSFDNVYSVDTELSTNSDPYVKLNIANGALGKWSSDYYGDVVRLVDNGSEPLQLVLSVSDGYVITGVTYEDYEDNRYNLSCDVGTFTNNQWTGSTQILNLTAATAYIDRMTVTIQSSSVTVPTVDLSVIPQTEGSTDNEPRAQFRFSNVVAETIDEYVAYMESQNTPVEGYVLEGEEATIVANNVTLALTTPNFLKNEGSITMLKVDNGATLTVSVPEGYRIDNIFFEGEVSQLQASAGQIDGQTWNGTGNEETYGLNTVTFTAMGTASIYAIEVNAVRYTTVEMPIITANGNVITIESNSPEAIIRYSVDGSIPDMYSPAEGESFTYSGPFEVSRNCIIKAIAGGDYMKTSDIAEYPVDWFMVDTVTFNRMNLELTMTCATPEATILYTVEGPTMATPPDTLTYNGPIQLTESCEIHALGRRTGWKDSEVRIYKFNATDVMASTPQIYRNGDVVEMMTTTPGATIYYTTDGTTPDTNSNVYADAIMPDSNYTIRAIAVAEYYFNSDVAEFNVDWLKVADVTFLYENLYLKMSTATPEAEIYYTTDGSMPGINSTHYVDSISLDHSCMVQAIAIRDGWNDSEVTNYEFVMEAVTAAMPQFARGNGNELIIATATQGANIYYTIDGSIPTTESTLYTAPIELNGNYTVNAIATGDALITSEVGTFNVDWYKVADVSFSYKNLKLAMATTTPDAEIYYTVDGTTPDINSTLYTDSISLDQDCEVKAIAIRNLWNDSEITTYTFSLSAVTAATPLITHNNNKILIETPTAGAVIYYTTDGSTPTTTSTVYADSIIVTSNCTIKAIATGTNLNPSEIASYEVDWFKVGNVEFTLHELRLFMTAVPDTAAIYYTTDGSAPSVLSTRYTEPVPLTTSCDVRAIAMINNWANSDVTLFHFNAVVYTAAKPQIIRNGNELIMSTTTADAHIYYTLDGTEPDDSSLEYTGTAIQLDGNYTVRAIAMSHFYLPSAISTYNVDWFKVADVEFAWSETSALTLELSTTTPEAAIYYTTDGSIPLYVDGQAINGQLYDSPLTLTQQDMDIRAIAVRDHWTNSDATLFHFNSASMTIATPQIVRSSANLLSITCATPNVAIYYTLNGAEPTVNDSLYSHPIALDGNGIVRAMAVSDSHFRSAVASYQVDWFKVASVDFTFIPGEGLSMTTTTPNAAIYYTLDGITPSATLGTPYTAPIQLTESRDVRAIAVRENWTNSEISLFHYIYGSMPAATPQFVRNGNELTITTETEGAEIFYTLDGTTPTEQAEHYDMPIMLAENGMVKAIAIVPGESQSGVASYTVNWFVVENILFSFTNEQLVMQTATPEATIYYTLDGTTPTRQSEVYTAPIQVNSSCLVQAFGTRENMHDSNISRYDLDLDNLSTATPVIERVGNTLVITCATLDATIYYTMDGSLPTPETAYVYDSPIVLSQNCTVRTIAVAPGYRNSGVADYTTDTFRVEDVHVEFVDGFLYLFTNTAGATIYYTLDGADPTTSSSVYEAPIPLTERRNVKAFAIKKDFTNSPIISVEIDPDDVKCAEPTIAQNDRMLTISTLTNGAQIYYTLDGTTPTTSSKLYVGPDSLIHNCTVQAIAVREGLKNSPVGSLVVDNFQTELPEVLFDKTDNSIAFSTSTPDATIYYTTDGGTPTTAYTGKFTWDGTSTYRVMAVAANFNNSEVVTFSPANANICASVQMTSYNGHSFTLASSDNATIYYTLDGSNPTTSSLRYLGETTVTGLSTVRAIAVKEGYNNSNVSIVELPCYFDGQTAYLRKAGSLSLALGDISKLSNLSIVGTLDAADFTAIRQASALRYLNLRETAIANGILPEGSLAGSGLVAVELPSNLSDMGADAFAGCDNLSALIWNANAAIPATALSSIANPNLLLYVNRAGYAPGNIQNVVAGYQAQSIVLSDAEQAGNFYCPRAFYAQSISYTHNYQLKSGRNKTSCGWETLALPFNVTSVQHETKGVIVPFATKNETNAQLPKFWLYSLDANTGRLVATSEIEANSPYLVCMPNNEEYADRFNLNGKVSFKASNAMIPITEAKTVTHNQSTFVPNFERKQASDKIFLLNRNVAGRPDGQIFLQGLRQANPFEAYFTNSDSSVRAIDLFGSETDDIMAVFNSQATTLKSQSVYDLQGRRIQQSTLRKGLYIVDGKKQVVK